MHMNLTSPLISNAFSHEARAIINASPVNGQADAAYLLHVTLFDTHRL